MIWHLYERPSLIVGFDGQVTWSEEHMQQKLVPADQIILSAPREPMWRFVKVLCPELPEEEVKQEACYHEWRCDKCDAVKIEDEDGWYE